MSKQKPLWGSKKALHAALKSLREKVLAGKIMHSFGICYNLSREFDPEEIGSVGYKVVQKYGPSWPQFSGDVGFPILVRSRNDNYAKWEGEQLALRLSLINHMIRSTR